METESSILLKVLGGEAIAPPPVWLMRQAGRYLREYQALRAKAGSFWSLCTTPSMAAEVTLQPVDRFDFDAAILFSDIMVVPFALGREVTYEDSIGPILAPVTSAAELDEDEEHWAERLSPAYETLRLVASRLSHEKALIGFAGAPWTLAAYMAEGRGSPDQKAAKLWAYRAPDEFRKLMDVLERCVAAHLAAQLHAGADVVQIFDSWAGSLPPRAFAEWVIGPTKRIVAQIRAEIPGARIIGFPRAATLEGYAQYAAETGVDAISVDTSVPMTWAAQHLAPDVAVQGNLDPLALVAGGTALDDAVDDIVAAMKGHRIIFNLGHGVLPETPVEHVLQLIARVRR